MKLLITGAFGNLGTMCIEQALVLGDSVVCVDVKNKRNKNTARRFGNRIQTVWGQIEEFSHQAASLHSMLSDVDAIIHNASVLPPITEQSPDLAQQVNVKGSLALIQWAESTGTKPVFIFPSSVTVFGLPQSTTSSSQYQQSASDPTHATDNYSAHKLTVENALQKEGIPWCILRIGVSVDARTMSTDRSTFKQLLDVHAQNPMEWVHPKDVALAMCNAARTPAAHNKILLIGGGKSCQVSHHQFMGTAFNALGLKFPPSIHGANSYYTHWMDTSESQQLLNYQQHTFDDYKAEMAAALRLPKKALWPFRWLLNPLVQRLPKLL